MFSPCAQLGSPPCAWLKKWCTDISPSVYPFAHVQLNHGQWCTHFIAQLRSPLSGEDMPGVPSQFAQQPPLLLDCSSWICLDWKSIQMTLAPFYQGHLAIASSTPAWAWAMGQHMFWRSSREPIQIKKSLINLHSTSQTSLHAQNGGVDIGTNLFELAGSSESQSKPYPRHDVDMDPRKDLANPTHPWIAVPQKALVMIGWLVIANHYSSHVTCSFKF